MIPWRLVVPASANCGQSKSASQQVSKLAGSVPDGDGVPPLGFCHFGASI